MEGDSWKFRNGKLAIIYNLIEPNVKVLDVGCGTGQLGEMLKIEKNCYVAGVDVDPRAIEEARKRLDHVIVADVEELDKLPYPKKYFDVIVFADVLEHLKRPEDVLKNLCELYLKDEGCVVVSVPNVANWTIRLKLLFGRFNYKESGILKKQHLKFYTLNTILKLLQDSGYKIIVLTSTSGWNSLDYRFLTRNPSVLWKSLLACNLILKAKRAK
jgi:methionine biosynthesis protein MetW